MEGRTRSSHRLSRPSTHRPALCAVLATSLYRHATAHLCFKPPGQLARGGRALIGASKPCEPGPPWSEAGCQSFPYLAVRGTLFLLTGPDDVEETPRRGRQPAFMGSEFYLPTVYPHCQPASRRPPKRVFTETGLVQGQFNQLCKSESTLLDRGHGDPNHLYGLGTQPLSEGTGSSSPRSAACLPAC